MYFEKAAKMKNLWKYIFILYFMKKTGGVYCPYSSPKISCTVFKCTLYTKNKINSKQKEIRN